VLGLDSLVGNGHSDTYCLRREDIWTAGGRWITDGWVADLAERAAAGYELEATGVAGRKEWKVLVSCIET
jgi:hypothetical protein